MNAPLVKNGFGLICCICFDGLNKDTCWKCPECETLWDMCINCGGSEGCLECKTREPRT